VAWLFGRSVSPPARWLDPGRDVDDRVRVEAVAVPDPADLDLISVSELILDELSLNLDRDRCIASGDGFVRHQVK